MPRLAPRPSACSHGATMQVLSRAERDAFLKRYEAGPALLRAAFEAVPAAARQFRPGPGAWSAHEIVVHCLDSEANGHVRLRLLLVDPAPLLVAYDQDEWVRALDGHGSDPELALRLIELLRANNAALLRRLLESAFGRAGRHTELGEYSDADWFRLYAEHLEIHARQIERNLAAWKARA